MQSPPLPLSVPSSPTAKWLCIIMLGKWKNENKESNKLCRTDLGETGGIHPGKGGQEDSLGTSPQQAGQAPPDYRGHQAGLMGHYQTATWLYLPKLLSLLVGQDAILSLGFFFLQELSDFSERPTSSFLISRTSCMRHLVKSRKEIFPCSSAPNWFMISATDSSIFNWRQTINKSFLWEGRTEENSLGETLS